MKALLIDDERLARVELRRLLAAHPEIEIVGEAANAAEARALIASLSPALLFLDIQMPAENGFALLESLDAAPLVVFTTAYDQFALQAFEVSALDYLVKPIAPARLAQALHRLPAPTGEPLKHLFVKDGHRCWFVKPEDLTLLESEGNYTRLYFGAERPLILKSLQALADRLSSVQFFRASRKHVINLEHILKIDLAPNDNLIATLRGGLSVELSRRQSALFKTRLSP